MPFPVLPRIGRTMNYSTSKKKSTPRAGGAWVATLFVPEIKTPPWKPPPISGSWVRHKQEWVAGAVGSVFGNLLVPRVPPL